MIHEMKSNELKRINGIDEMSIESRPAKKFNIHSNIKYYNKLEYKEIKNQKSNEIFQMKLLTAKNRFWKLYSIQTALKCSYFNQNYTLIQF